MIGQQSSVRGVTLVSPWLGFAGSDPVIGVPPADMVVVVGTTVLPVKGSMLDESTVLDRGCMPGPNTTVSAWVTTVSIAVKIDSNGLAGSAGPSKEPKNAMVPAKSA